jgi:AcrR family transcriptional regulator
VSRRPNPERKIALLNQVVAYMKEHGLADLTLRPLASALETSPRNLLYHFRSSSELITASLEAIAREDTKDFEEQFGDLTASSVKDLIARFAKFFDGHKDSIRIYVELASMELTNAEDLGNYLSRLTGPWYDLLSRTLEKLDMETSRANDLATLIVGVMWGRYLTATGDPLGQGPLRAQGMVSALSALVD